MVKKFKEVIKKEFVTRKAVEEVQKKSRYPFACSVSGRRVFRTDTHQTLVDMYPSDYVIVTDDMTYLLDVSVPPVQLEEILAAMERALKIQPITHRDMIDIANKPGSWHGHLSLLIQRKSVEI